MKNIKLLGLVLIMLNFGYTFAQESNVIPRPYISQHSSAKEFTITDKTTINCTSSLLATEAQYLANQIKLITSKNLLIDEAAKGDNVILLYLDPMLDKEEYTIKRHEGIICTASTPEGMLYAIQTLLQEIKEQDGNYTLSISDISDTPRYGWRGMMLDESRHFFGIEVVKNMLDAMAHLKLNVFHWHLTDEDGWRIEIKKYPKLTEIGAVGNWSDKTALRKFYTQDEIKEIVAYAGERHIMVVPEIDMPGHATAVSKAYPEISGGGEGRWTGFTYHPARETTYEFIENVFDEVFALFPAPYIHIGGDEVHFGNQSWSTDPEILQFIKDHDLVDAIGLEHYFVRRVCALVNSKGRKMIGWDEMLASGVTPEQAIVMWWRHDKPQELTKALDRGFQVILTPRIPCYFDFVQDDVQKIGRRWGKAYAPIQSTHSFPNSVAQEIAGYDNQILGMQANIWTERIADTKRLYYMVFPRLSALSEAAWTIDKNKDYSNYEIRLKPFLKWLDQRNMNYFNLFDKDSTPEPWGPTKQDVIAEG